MCSLDDHFPDPQWSEQRVATDGGGWFAPTSPRRPLFASGDGPEVLIIMTGQPPPQEGLIRPYQGKPLVNKP